MTCHNTTTLFCFKYEKSLFILKEDENLKFQVILEKKPDINIRDELASGINYQIDFLNLDFRQTYSLTKDYYQKCLGNSFEYLIKLMTKGCDGFDSSKRIEFIELLTGETFNNFAEEDIFFHDSYPQINDKKILLEEIELDTKNDSNKNKLDIYWPTSRINEAWDFMIFYQKKLYLYQVYTGKKDIKEQFKKSENVFKRLITNKNFDIWIQSKLFFIKSKLEEGLNNENFSDLQYNKICNIKEIFEDLFLTHQKLNKNSDVSEIPNQKINFIYQLNKDFYAINFTDNTIKIFRYENEDLIFVNSLIGHSEKPKNAFFVKDENEKILIKSIDIKENTFVWNFDIDTSNENDFGDCLNKRVKNSKILSALAERSET
ncbi:unnamed protein product [Brachionus calyciflorus]|uniref:Uncharacterized protein n=1 Tax=Brachionus calyciflorus TaxID=104777 RepID=A0A814CIJ6_9BILA|nr:unnamed protein product [Brachionus calyciflorus]